MEEQEESLEQILTGKRVLIIEDNKRHINRAYEQLIYVSFDLCENYLDAVRKINGGYKDGQKIEKTAYDIMIVDMFVPFSQGKWDPGSMASHTFDNSPQTFGYALSLLGIKNEVPVIAILSDLNHHAGPITATFDNVRTDSREKQYATIGYTKFFGGEDTRPWGTQDEGKDYDGLLRMMMECK